VHSLPTERDLAQVPDALRDAYRRDLGIADTAARNWMAPTTANSRARTWTVWREFCAEHNVPVYLQGLECPLAPLQVFAVRYRRGQLRRGGRRVLAGTISDALLAIGSEIERVADQDPRVVPGTSGLKWQLRDLLRCLRRLDPPPDRQWPVNFAILARLFSRSKPQAHTRTEWDHLKALTGLGYFFLCRPGEYATASGIPRQTRSTPFTLADVSFSCI
jgi:hypothetical protein